MQLDLNVYPHEAKFDPGAILVTVGIEIAMHEERLGEDDLSALLSRHLKGDWGNVSEEDAGHNDASLCNGVGVLLSVYVVKGHDVWVWTEHDRIATTLLLEWEY